MISRTLGPEVGGSIGLMFYLANVCGCAVSLLGLVEAVLDVFGAGLCSPYLVHVVLLVCGVWNCECGRDAFFSGECIHLVRNRCGHPKDYSCTKSLPFSQRDHSNSL